MKILKPITLFIAVICLVLVYKAAETKQAQAPSYGMMAGDIEKGKVLFNDTTFGSGTSGKSCNSCHLVGKGLEMAGDKKKFNIMGKKQNSLEEAVNFCIEIALKGKAIDPNGKDMKDIMAYIKSLKK